MLVPVPYKMLRSEETLIHNFLSTNSSLLTEVKTENELYKYIF